VDPGAPLRLGRARVSVVARAMPTAEPCVWLVSALSPLRSLNASRAACPLPFSWRERCTRRAPLVGEPGRQIHSSSFQCGARKSSGTQGRSCRGVGLACLHWLGILTCSAGHTCLAPDQCRASIPASGPAYGNFKAGPRPPVPKSTLPRARLLRTTGRRGA